MYKKKKEKEISRKVFTEMTQETRCHRVRVFARSPTTPPINRERPSTLNERVPPSATSLPFRALLPFHPLPPPTSSVSSLLSYAPVTMLRNRDARQRRPEAGGGMGGAGACFETTVSTALQPRGDLKGEPS